ncbi:DUF262 domain-containing protein [Gallibacterium trehalosifermentans]|uniref:DUF262 domain-containing protein n=1 Tax=Gallibacterium trehalosifermentans TaxID=516935 RepID=A0ABV6GYM2_9PAST
MDNNQVKTLTVSELCNGDKYIIPIYQRNYAWGKDEIELLIQDILEAKSKNNGRNYYIGSLVVAKRKDSYEVIDGQQRLTTLKLLLSYHSTNKNINLTFEHRDESNHSLNNLGKNNQYNNSIEIGYKIILDIFSAKNNKNSFNENDFFHFLLEKVVILRTEVPEDTDLNHYFEIMNNRGEQLEKHEVLKARLMDKLTDDDDKKLFALIWDACSDMSVYAIMRFPKDIRISKEFFDNSVNKIPNDFDEMLIGMNNNSTQEDSDKASSLSKILDLLNSHQNNKVKQANEMLGRFNAIIDFPNFLMIVYKIFSKKDIPLKNIPLNDKYLLNAFKSMDNQVEIKKFIVCLLRTRLIFDRYIIKSKEEEERWILNGIKKYKNGSFREVNTFGTALEQLNNDDNEDGDTDDLSENHTKIVQLLSMFHISFRQKTYKNWLFDVLDELNQSLKNEYDLDANKYINILELLAHKYYQEAYKYYQDDDRQKLLEQGGQAIPHYIFNYLDYLLWKDWDNIGKDNIFLRKNNFVFSLSRNSIEHYLPQSKSDMLGDVNNVDSFGNLCLISHYQNSSLNNQVPLGKRMRYENGSLKCISPKQALMLSYETWGEKEIEDHYKEMIKYF